jgi:Ca2+-binding RTX toxin-like protein
VIVSGSGADRISAGGGRDLICSGGGADIIDGGNGRDRIFAGPGDDTIVGGPGGEVAIGGSGADRIFGGQQDDRLIGSSEDDLLVGDHGNDMLRGMTGDDWLRGDTGNNHYDGGPGNDTASFASDLSVRVRLNGPAFGYGEWSSLHEVENVVGTVGSDEITGWGVPSAGSVRGLGWATGAYQYRDACAGFSQVDCGQSLTGGDAPAVVADSTGPDPGVIVAGGVAAETIRTSSTSGGIQITDSSPIASAAGCIGSGTTTVTCPISGPPGHVVVFGMGGDDTLVNESNFGPTTTVMLDGGGGADGVTGGPGNEILASGGGSGNIGKGFPPDQLDGAGGDDSLLGGAVVSSIMHGGPGSDQLVAAGACNGDLIDGGPGGSDIAGFAQSGSVIAQIGGQSAERQISGPCVPSHVSTSNEILEGTNQDDVLIGSRGSDPLIIGHGGDDVIKGLGGADGLRGDDGRDKLLGGGGADSLDARDGERDRRIDCGPGGARASRDGLDPPARGCQR